MAEPEFKKHVPAQAVLALSIVAAWVYLPTPLGTFETTKLLLMLLGVVVLTWLPGIAALSMASYMLLALGLVHAAFALDPQLSVVGRAPRALGLATLGLGLFAFAQVRAIDAATREMLSKRLLAVLAIGALLATGQWIWLQLPWAPAGIPGLIDGRAGGTIGNPTQAGAVFAAAAVWAWRRHARWPFALCLLAVLASGSRAAALALVVAMALMAIRKRWSVRAMSWRHLGVLAALLPLLAIAVWRGVAADSVSLRGHLSQSALRALQSPTLLVSGGSVAVPDPYGAWRPWIGYGLDQQVAALSANRQPAQNAFEAGGSGREADRAHLLPLDLLLVSGIGGWLLCLWAVLALLRQRDADAPPGALAAALTLLLASSVGIFGLVEAWLLAIWLGLATRPATRPEAPHWQRVLLALGCIGALGVAQNQWQLQQQARAAIAAYAAARDAAQVRAAAQQLCDAADLRPVDMSARLSCAQARWRSGDLTALDQDLKLLRQRLPTHPRLWLLQALRARQVADAPALRFALSQYDVCVGAAVIDAQRLAEAPLLTELNLWLAQQPAME